AAFRRRSPPGRVDEDLSHYASRDGIEVRAIPEVRIVTGRKSQVGFVDECRCLQLVPSAFPAHVTGGQVPELLIDERRQAVQCGGVAASPGLEKRRDLVRAG